MKTFIPITNNTNIDPGILGGKGIGLLNLLSVSAAIPRTVCIPPNVDLQKAIPDVLEYLSDPKADNLFAVRSSADVEDGTLKSYAGQFESYLRISGKDNLIKAVEKCRLSGESERLKSYHGGEEIKVSVLIQKMIEADFAGVLFTCDPVTGSRNHIVLETVMGTAENLVGGTVLSTRLIFDNECMLIDAGENIPADKDLLTSLVKEALEIEKNLEKKGIAGPLDFEWAVKDEEIFWLQVRPVTAMGKQGNKGEQVFFLKPGEIPEVKEGEIHWTSQNSREALPGVIHPLTEYTIKTALKIGFWGAVEPSGVSREKIDNIEILEFFNGRAFLNVTGMCKLFSHTPIKNSDEMIKKLLSGKKAAIHKPDFSLKLLGILFNFAVRDIKVLWNFHKVVNEVLEKVKYPTEDEVKKLSLAELGRQSEKLMSFGDLLTQQIIGTGHYMGSYGFMNSICEKYGANPSDMILGMGTLKFASSSGYLRELAYSLQPEKGLLFDENCRLKEGWKEILASDPRLSGFKKLFDKFLEDFGHIGSGSIDLYEKNWREKPGVVLSMAGDLLRSGSVVSREEYLKQLSKKREKAIKELRSKLSFKDRLIFPIALWLMQKAAPLRENAKFAIHRVMAVGKAYLEEMGSRLAKNDILNESDDIYYLKYGELFKIVNENAELSFKESIGKRRMDHRRFQGIPCPLHRIESKNGIRLYYTAPAGEGNEFHGVGACAGSIMGKARVILNIDESARLNPGEILVTTSTDPSWTPLFSIAGGVVVEIGSLLSHGAVVARETGIPAVLGIPGIVGKIKDGDTILVDGSEGKVVIRKQ